MSAPFDPRTLIARRLLPRLMAGDLSPVWARVVRRWVDASDVLRAEYEAMLRLERAVRGPDAPLSAARRDLLRAMLVPEPVAPSRSVTPALAGASAVACMALFLVAGRVPTDQLAARGARLAQDPVGVKVSCLDPVGSKVLASATGGARQSGARLSCPRGSLLAFSTTNLSDAPRHAFVVGVAPGGALRWYTPFSQQGASQHLHPGTVDAVLPVLADTGAMPDDASVSLFVLVSDEAFDARSLERRLARSVASGVLLDRLERLPVDVPLQARIDMVRTP